MLLEESYIIRRDNPVCHTLDVITGMALEKTENLIGTSVLKHKI